MTRYTLSSVINNDDDSISLYLESVSISEFKEDLSEYVSKFTDKGAIRNAVEQLSKLL